MFKIICILVIVGLAAAEETCTCDEINNDIEQLRIFLAKPLDSTPYPVLPGELSPVVCNCEKNRKKRSKSDLKRVVKVVPVDMETKKKVVRAKNNCPPQNQWGNNNCPSGYTRVGLFCMPHRNRC